MKKLLAKVLIFCLLICSLSYSVNADVDEGDFYGTYYGQAVDFGPPFEQLLPLDSVTGTLNGHNMLYTSSSGTWARFYAYDLTDEKIVFEAPLTGAKACWTHKKSKSGIIYMCADGYVFSYNPYTNDFKSYGRALGEKQSFEAALDSEDNLYIATYPNCRIAKLDTQTGEITDFLGKEVVDGHTYVRSMCIVNDIIYCTTYGDGDNVAFVKIDIKTKKVTNIPVPEIKGYMELDKILWLYAVTVAGDYIFINVKTDDGSPMLIYNWKKEEFVLREEVYVHFRGHHVSEPYEDKVYFISGFSGNRKLLGFDLTKEEIFDTGIDYFKSAENFIFGTGWIELDDPQFPDKTMVTVNENTGAIVFINPKSKMVKEVVYPEMTGGSQMIRSLENGPLGTITLGAYLGSKGAFYNIKDHSYKYFKTHQLESSETYEDITYFMTYTRAGFNKVEYSTLNDGDEATVLKATVGEEQDRAFAHTSGGGKVFFGTIPDYGKLGGALVVHDVKTGEIEVFRNVVENQSIISLEYKNGYVYGSTSVWGGGSAEPTEKQAKIFVWDVEQKKKVDEFYPLVPNCNYDMKAIGDIRFDKNEDLWCASNNLVFSVDVNTKRVKKYVHIGENSYGKEIWTPCPIDFDKNGFLYFISQNTIWVVNPKNMDYKNLNSKFDEKQSCSFMRIGSDNNLYYGGLGRLKMIPIMDNEYRTSDYLSLKDQFKGTVLLNEEPYMFSGNRIWMIDEKNENVVPVMEGNTILAPARKLCNLYEIRIDWNDDGTFTLEKCDNKLQAEIGNTTATFNGKTVKLATSPQLIHDKTYISVADFAGYFNIDCSIYENGVVMLDDKANHSADVSFKMFTALKYYAQDYYKEHEGKNNLVNDYLNIVNLDTTIKIPNGTFEDNALGKNIDTWKMLYANTENAYCEVTDINSFLGNKSLRLTDRTDLAGTGVVSQNIMLAPDKNYSIKIPMYIAEGTPSVRIEYLDSSGNVVISEMDNMADLTRNQWHILNYDVRTFSNIAGVRITVMVHTSYFGDIFVDEIVVKEN